MAGAGYKLFQTGDVLTAAQVNTYLNEQTVMVFASAAARTSALTSVLAEGMVSYLQDTNAVEVYDGSAWVSIGASGDITGVTAGTGISGGGTSGTVTITNDMATTITAAGDIVVGTGSGTYDNLPIGTTGQVLTADTTVSPYKVKWAAAGGGAYTSVATGSLSGTTSITSLSTSYTDLYIIIKNFTMSSTGNLTLKFNNDSTASYHLVNFTGGDSSLAQNSVLTAGTTCAITTDNIQTGSNGNQLIINLYDYTSTSPKLGLCEFFYYSDNNRYVRLSDRLAYRGTSAITQIDIASNGTISGGTYTVYGVK